MTQVLLRHPDWMNSVTMSSPYIKDRLSILAQSQLQNVVIKLLRIDVPILRIIFRCFTPIKRSSFINVLYYQITPSSNVFYQSIYSTCFRKLLSQNSGIYEYIR